MIKQYIIGFTAFAVLLFPGLASAHVVVMPSQVNIAEFTTFTVSVPNERNVAVSEVKLEIPNNLNYVTPSVKSGWTVTPQKVGEGDEAKITSIVWSGGSIPAGLRDDFTFSAQAPDKASTIEWNAFQTYEDGTTVKWNQSSDSEKTDEELGPNSETKVVNDTQSSSTADVENKESDSVLPLALSLLAIVISIGGLLFSRKR